MIAHAWHRLAGWLWDTTGLTPATLLGAALIAAVFGYLWHASR